MMAMGLGLNEVVFLPLMWFLALGGGPGVPLGVPPLPEDPMMARIAPEQCLWYVSWSGTAKPDPNSKNETEQLLAEPEVQHLLKVIEREIKLAVQREADGNAPEAIAIRSLPDLFKTLMTRPTAAYIERASFDNRRPSFHGGLIINTGQATAEVARSLKQFELLAFDNARIETFEAGAATWRRLPLPEEVPEVAWTARGGYVIIAVGDGSATGMIERARTEPPKWLTKMKAELPVERTSMVSYLNIESVYEEIRSQPGAREVLPSVHALGLDNLLALENVSGLDGDGCVSRSRLKLDGDPRGLLTLLDGEPLTSEQLKTIPRNAMIATTVRMDAGKALDLFLETLGKFEPRAQVEARRELKQLEETMGVRFSADILEPLGDVWSIYNTPDDGLLTGLTAVVSIDDSERLTKTHGKLIAFFRAMQQLEGRRPRRGEPTIRQFEFAEQEVYFLNFHGASSPVAPAWCIVDDQLVVGLYPQAIKAFLTRDGAQGSLADVAAVSRLMETEQGTTMVAYNDTQSLFKLVYPALQVLAQFACSELQREGIDIDISALPASTTVARHLRPGTLNVARTNTGFEFTSRQTLPAVGGVGGTLPLAAAVALPAIFSARSRARAISSMSNLRQLGLVMHIVHDQKRQLPTAFSVDAQGKPLLSWRVHVLPYIEQARLYEEFRFDEPWDSPHNRKLIPKMPAIYRSPASGVAGQFKTNYLTVRGPDTLFPGDKQIQFKDVTDGTSNTIMVVEANDQHAVIWTKPDDYEYDAKQPAAGLARPGRGSFVAAFADGSVRSIAADVEGKLLNALFTRNGGEAVGTIPSESRSSRGRSNVDRDETDTRDAAGDDTAADRAVDEPADRGKQRLPERRADGFPRQSPPPATEETVPRARRDSSVPPPRKPQPR